MLFKIYRYNSGFRSNCILPKINTTNAKRKWLLNKLNSERSVSMMQSEYFICFLLISSIWTLKKYFYFTSLCSHWFTWLNKNCGFYLFYGNSRKKVFLFICVRVYVIGIYVTSLEHIKIKHWAQKHILMYDLYIFMVIKVINFT